MVVHLDPRMAECFQISACEEAETPVSEAESDDRRTGELSADVVSQTFLIGVGWEEEGWGRKRQRERGDHGTAVAAAESRISPVGLKPRRRPANHHAATTAE